MSTRHKDSCFLSCLHYQSRCCPDSRHTEMQIALVASLLSLAEATAFATRQGSPQTWDHTLSLTVQHFPPPGLKSQFYFKEPASLQQQEQRSMPTSRPKPSRSPSCCGSLPKHSPSPPCSGSSGFTTHFRKQIVCSDQSWFSIINK